MSLTAEEQLLLELTNRARLDPDGEAARLAGSRGPVTSGTLSSGTSDGGDGITPLEPLAGNTVLAGAAGGHADWIIANDRFSHTGADGTNAGQRIAQAGYTFEGSSSWSENLAFLGSSAQINVGNAVYAMHANLHASTGHRQNMLADGVREIGIAVGLGEFLGMNATVAVQNYARSGNDSYLSGVVYNDLDGDDFYSIGEGVGGVTFSAGTRSATTAGAGGYTLRLSGETSQETVTISTGRATYQLRILERDGNVKIDLVDGHTIATSADIELMGRTANAIALGAGDLTLVGSTLGNRLTGNAGDNLLQGRGGNDILIGGGGADTLVGGVGRDVLVGDRGGLYGADASAQVFRLYNAVFGRDPDSAGHQGWTQRLASGELSMADIALRFMVSAEFQNTYGALSDAAFVTLLYQNVLDRAPDAAGHSSWMQNLSNGMDRETVVLRFSESAEHRRLSDSDLFGFEQGHDATVYGPQLYRLYLAVLGREADVAGFETWMDRLEGGMSIGEVTARFMASTEFQSAYGALDDAAFVTMLYDNVLDRPPDAAGFESWMDRLEGGMSRVDLVQRFADSREFRLNTAAETKAFMRGLGPDDRLDPGPGNSLLSGGAGADTFVFTEASNGRHEITDLEPWDFVELTGFGYGSATEARTHITQAGDDAVFSDQGVTIVFLDTQAHCITQDMILV